MKKTVYISIGFLFLGLAILGALLPVVPSTPFLLLAAWFFARSSEKWHQRLLNSQLFGPIIRNWEASRCISCRTKLVSITLMLGMGGISLIFAVQDDRVRLAALLLMTLGCITLLSLKTCPPDAT
ncbi:MAG: YbaN family protein [Halioglobus sp.]